MCAVHCLKDSTEYAYVDGIRGLYVALYVFNSYTYVFESVFSTYTCVHMNVYISYRTYSSV